MTRRPGRRRQRRSLQETEPWPCGRVLSREYVQERVWNDDESYSNTIAVRIRQLRQKVDEGHAVRLIHTVDGQGYVLRAPESDDPPPTG